MERRDSPSDTPSFGPGTSILGGAACGLTYEGARQDAIARDDLARRREAARHRRVAPPQTQARVPELADGPTT